MVGGRGIVMGRPATGSTRKKALFSLPPDLARKLRIAAARDGVTMSFIVTRALEDYLSLHKSVSSAGASAKTSKNKNA